MDCFGVCWELGAGRTRTPDTGTERLMGTMNNRPGRTSGVFFPLSRALDHLLISDDLKTCLSHLHFSPPCFPERPVVS